MLSWFKQNCLGCQTWASIRSERRSVYVSEPCRSYPESCAKKLILKRAQQPQPDFQCVLLNSLKEWQPMRFRGHKVKEWVPWERECFSPSFLFPLLVFFILRCTCCYSDIYKIGIRSRPPDPESLGLIEIMQTVNKRKARDRFYNQVIRLVERWWSVTSFCCQHCCALANTFL